MSNVKTFTVLCFLFAGPCECYVKKSELNLISILRINLSAALKDAVRCGAAAK